MTRVHRGCYSDTLWPDKHVLNIKESIPERDLFLFGHNGSIQPNYSQLDNDCMHIADLSATGRVGNKQ